MRLETALINTLSGLNGHSKALAVLGDNIANVSTTGYKRSRIEFSNMMNTLGNVSDEISTSGNGSDVATIRQVHTGGLVEPTDRALDVGIEGTGFFQVGDADSPSFTRAGNFTVTADGVLTTQDGLPVLGLQPDGGDAIAPIDILNLNLTGQATTSVTVTGNVASNSTIGEVPANPESFSDLNAVAGFANSVEVYDSLGTARTISFYYTKTAAGTWTAAAYADGADVGGEEGVPSLLGSTTLSFGTNGRIAEENQGAAVFTVSPAWNEAAQNEVSIDLSGMTQFAALSQTGNIIRDGLQAGTNIRDYEITKDGGVYARLNTGENTLMGTLQLASVTNPETLTRIGNGLYTSSTTSGPVTTGVPGTGSFGTTQGRALERSNVDLTTEFTDLVVYQSGYQANSQVLSAVADMLQRSISLIR